MPLVQPGTNPRTITARQLLAQPIRPLDVAVSAVHPSPPTVTAGTSWAGTSIANAILIPFKTLTSGGDTDVANDPHVEFIGYPQGSLAADAFAAGFVRPGYLPGGSGQNARHRGLLSFVYTGSIFELRYAPTSSSTVLRTFIDDLPATTGVTTLTTNGGSDQCLKWDFGSYAPREIQIEIPDPRFGGIYIQPDATISRTKRRRQTIGILGDSISAGAVGVAATNTFFYYVTRLLGGTAVNLGIGGTGYIAGAPTGDFRSRIATAVSAQPSLLYVFGGYNDDAQTIPTITAEATYVLSQLSAQLPNTIIVVMGCWAPTGDTTFAAHVNIDNALRDIATSLGLPFLSLLDPTNWAATGTAWAPSTAYVMGDIRVSGGRAWECRNGHTSGGSFAVGSNWVAVGFLRGTGSVGALANNGNRDRVIGSVDQVHPNQNGHYDLAWFVAQETQRILQALAAA